MFHTGAALLLLHSLPLTVLPLADSPPDDPARRELMQRAAAVVPSDRQLAWQRLEFQCFVHFGPNTFTGREWGEGTEDPRLFNPSDLDAEQWAIAAKDAGMKALVLVAKHHDGFCLWPSRFTEHSVKNSPWKNGRGDVVRDASEACRRHGLKFGVYLSPADLHEPTYGQSDKYNAYFLNQLRELLTNYGPIHEVWFDGATPKDKGQVYDYQAWYALIRELQPDAVIFGRGPDVRWVGNEAGHGRPSEWSVIPLAEPVEACVWPDLTANDLGSLAKLGGAKHLHWYPAETDTSIRPGWFWRSREDTRVRSLQDLLNVYYHSVGNNCVLLLNVPPDTRGRFHENDVARLKELGQALRGTFANNLAAGATVSASAALSEHPASLSLDNNPDTCWTTPDFDHEPGIVWVLPEPRTVSVVMLQEHLQSGQRVEQFVIEAWDANRWAASGSGWVELATGTTIGYKKLARFPRLTTDRVRVRFIDSRVRPTLAEFGLFDEPAMPEPPAISRSRSGDVTLTSPGPDAGRILYTLDGSEPSAGAAGTLTYAAPFPLPRGGLVRARALPSRTDGIPGATASARFDVSKARWSIVRASSEQPEAGERKEHAIDDNPATIWHTRYSPETPKHPHELVIDLGEQLTLAGFTYTPRPGGGNGTIARYELHTSLDGQTWAAPFTTGEFKNPLTGGEHRVMLPEPRAARFVRFVALSERNGQPWASAAEIGVLTHGDQ